MKMLVVTSIKEDMQQVTRIMEAAHVKVFSVSDTIGHKNEKDGFLLNNWFASGDSATQALFFFSFTENENAAKALELIKEYNSAAQSSFPLRAFILPVEACSYTNC